MRKLTGPGLILLLFALAAAMAARGPIAFGGGKAGLYHGLQTAIDGNLVGHLGRPGAAIALIGCGLVLAAVTLHLLSRRERQGEAPARSKADPQQLAEAEAELQAASERRIAAMRQRTGDDADTESFAEPEPVLVLRRSHEADWSGARSWLGGEPRLGELTWPIGRNSGRPLPFAAQIDLGELAARCPGSGMPEAGSLAFFLGEGAVLHVPEALDGQGHPRTPAPNGTPTLSSAASGSDAAHPEVPWWPVDLHPLSLPADLPNRRSCDAAGAEAIAVAQHQAAGAIAPHRAGRLSATALCAELGIDPVPLWWHSVRLFAAGLDEAAARAEALLGQARAGLAEHEAKLAEMHEADAAGDAITVQEWEVQRQQGRVGQIEEQCAKVPAAREALQWFMQDHDEWSLLGPADRADFLTLHAEIREHCGELARSNVPADPLELATASLRAALRGPDHALAAIPAELRAAIDSDWRQPVAVHHQMFGQGTNLQGAARDHVDYVMLLQLAGDDVIDWNFGQTGLYQFWLAPRDASLGRWDRARLTFESQ